ncbi:MAG: hypothetical protein AAGI88_24600 [Pseudomonadota bacterium]
MTRDEQHLNARRGFALITALFSLAVLTILFSTASVRSVNHLRNAAVDLELAIENAQRMDVLRLAARHANIDGENAFTMVIGDVEWTLQFQDVGGLIDLNTAAPELLERLVLDLSGDAFIAAEALDRYQDWRRAGRRLARTSDFLRVTGLAQEHRERLRRVATVYSGRRGIAPDVAPLEVLRIVTGPDGDREDLIGQLDGGLISARSGRNFMVKTNGAGEVVLGNINKMGETSYRVLSF